MWRVLLLFILGSRFEPDPAALTRAYSWLWTQISPGRLRTQTWVSSVLYLLYYFIISLAPKFNICDRKSMFCILKAFSFECHFCFINILRLSFARDCCVKSTNPKHQCLICWQDDWQCLEKSVPHKKQFVYCYKGLICQYFYFVVFTNLPITSQTVLYQGCKCECLPPPFFFISCQLLYWRNTGLWCYVGLVCRFSCRAIIVSTSPLPAF